MATHSRILAWKKFMDRGAWWAAVHGEPKSLTQQRSMKQQHTTILTEAIRCTHTMQHGWIIKTNYLGGKKSNIKEYIKYIYMKKTHFIGTRKK